MAARVGDQSVHGGTITLGSYDVFIEFRAAARATDQHICPLLTPPPPHGAGIISWGSPTVIINFKLAARMGDPIMCAGGGPNMISTGAASVLIGDGGGGGGGAGGGGGPSGSGGAQGSARSANTGSPESITKEPHWVAFEVVDSAGLPLSGISYTFTDPDTEESEGVLRVDGTIMRDALPSGTCNVLLMNVSQAQWAKATATVGEAVQMSAATEGFEDGTTALFQVFKRDFNQPDVVVGEVEAQVQGDAVEAEWTLERDEDITLASHGDIEQTGFSAPTYYFEVLVGRCQARSGMLVYTDQINIELKSAQDQGLPGEAYVLYLPNGEVRKGTLGSDGTKIEEKVPPGPFNILFPDRMGVEREEEDE